MTETNLGLSDLLAKQDGGDFTRSVAEAVLRLVMETNVEGLIGASKHERSTDRGMAQAPGDHDMSTAVVSFCHATSFFLAAQRVVALRAHSAFFF